MVLGRWRCVARNRIHLHTMKKKTTAQLKREIRQAVADYMYSEGCSCCRDNDSHKEHARKLAKLLSVPQYDDGSGYDFYKFRTVK